MSQTKKRIFKELLMVSIRKYVLLTVGILCLSFSFAIVTRHDVSDKAYLELGQQYPSFVELGNGCGGTLIAWQWVITAAHCTEVDSAKKSFSPEEVRVGKQWIVVVDIKLHEQADIALLRLSQEITHVKPVPLYESFNEPGQIAVLVGQGGTGNGLEGKINHDNLLRGARNEIEDVDNDVIRFKMDDPVTALDLEGVGGPGDSGGPAYIETDEGIFLAGISSYGEWSYGDFDHYVRVSTYVPWIKATMVRANRQRVSF